MFVRALWAILIRLHGDAVVVIVDFVAPVCLGRMLLWELCVCVCFPLASDRLNNQLICMGCDAAARHKRILISLEMETSV